MEVRRYRVIQDVIEKRRTQFTASEELELSVRQVRRLQKKVREKGPEGLIHGLVGRKSNSAMREEMIRRVILLWEERYRECGLNFTHFTEKLNEKEGVSISKEKVRQILRGNGLGDKKPKRGRKHRRQRARRQRFGELIQQDTSPHDWLGIGKIFQAINVVDDATSRILFLRLYEHDGTLPNMQAMRDLILKFGLPMAYYVDKASWFKVTRHWTATVIKQNSSEYETQIERALDELGIELIYADSPQAKGRVERKNGTLQDRLISELKLANCKTLEAANRFIDEVFIPDHDRRFGVEPTEPESAFVPFLKKDVLDRILCLRFTSTVQNDNTISKSGLYKLQLLPTPQRSSWVRAIVEVSILIDGRIEVRHEKTHQVIPHEVLEVIAPKEEKHSRISRLQEETIAIEKGDSRRWLRRKELLLGDLNAKQPMRNRS